VVTRAVILAAGRGRRLGVDRPKCLLEFGDKTLLQRHLEILTARGIDRVTIGVGYKADTIKSALACRDTPRVSVVDNPDYVLGSIVTLWTLRESMISGDDIVLMDADVLYDYRMIARLLESRHRNCFLLDRDLEAGDEPVKLCVRDGRLVEFRKQASVACDYCGESVGIFRLSSEMAAKLVDAAACYIDAARLDQPYEEALRDVLLAEPNSFGFENVTSLPWIEIDFLEDVNRARDEILPRLVAPGPDRTR
jgi:choline kinase